MAVVSVEDGTYTLTWNIENISLYTEEMNIDLTTPSFEVGTTECMNLQMYLNSGDWATKNIGVHILGSSESLYQLFQNLNPYSEITLLCADGGVVESKGSLLRHTCEGRPSLFSKEKVLLLFTPQNTLTIRWNLYNIGSGEYFLSTIFQREIIHWNIHDFSKNLTFTKLFQISSLYFTINLTKWQFKPKTKMEIIIVNIIPSNQDRLHFGNCAIAVVDENIIYRYGEVNILYDKNIPLPRWGAPVMLDQGSCRCIKNDTLSLCWEFTVGIGDIWNGKENTNHKITIPETEDGIDLRKTIQMSSSNLSNDLLRLYEERKFCDATLTTGTASFQVQKNVLSARSPVFCAMFESDTEEGRSGVVHIPDVEPDTLDRMLMFLYTDSLGDTPWEMASGLYYAADKYNIQSLKEKSLRVLKEKLSVANACDALVLADAHSDEDLMESVKDFIFDHREVVCSTDWKELEENNPRLAIQMFREMMHFKRNN